MTATCAVQAKDGPATSSRIPWRIQPIAVPSAKPVLLPMKKKTKLTAENPAIQ